MSLFHEGLKNILKDVLQFLKHDLQKEKLGAESKKRTQQIIAHIEKFNREEAPQWDLSTADGGDGEESYVDPAQTNTPPTSPKTPKHDDDTDFGDNIPDLAATALAKAEVSGWLHKIRKKASLLGNSQKRWCAIQDGVFYYFKTEKEKKPAGGFYLKDYLAKHMHGDGKKLEFLFSLQCPGKREYQFIATSDEDMQKWLEVINGEPYTAKTVPGKASQEDMDGEDYEDVDNHGNNEEDPQSAIDEDVYEEVPEQQSKSEKSPAPAVLPPRGEKPSPRGPPPTLPTVPSPVKPTQTKTIPEPEEVYDDTAPEQEIYDDVAGEDEIYDDCAAPTTAPTSNKSALHSGPASANKAPQLQPNRSSLYPPKVVKQPPSEDGETKYDKLYYGLYDCTAEANTELSFRRGDIIRILSKEFEHHKWWVGELGGKVGIVPMTYLSPAYELVK